MSLPSTPCRGTPPGSCAWCARDPPPFPYRPGGLRFAAQARYRTYLYANRARCTRPTFTLEDLNIDHGGSAWTRLQPLVPRFRVMRGIGEPRWVRLAESMRWTPRHEREFLRRSVHAVAERPPKPAARAAEVAGDLERELAKLVLNCTACGQEVHYGPSLLRSSSQGAGPLTQTTTASPWGPPGQPPLPGCPLASQR